MAVFLAKLCGSMMNLVLTRYLPYFSLEIRAGIYLIACDSTMLFIVFY